MKRLTVDNELWEWLNEFEKRERVYSFLYLNGFSIIEHYSVEVDPRRNSVTFVQ